MSLIAAQNGLSQAVQTSVMSVNTASGASGTLTTNSITGSSITINNPNSQTVGTSITIPVQQSQQGIVSTGITTTFPPSGGGGGTAGNAGQQTFIHNGSGNPSWGGTGIASGYVNWQRPLTENDLKSFVEFFSSLFSGFVLVDNETTAKKEVFPMFEGFQVFQLAKNMGQKVNVTMLDQKTAEILYGSNQPK